MYDSVNVPVGAKREFRVEGQTEATLYEVVFRKAS